MDADLRSDYKNIVIQEIPLIDVRSPIEFKKGAFLNALNLPLMTDEERHLVGICYKEKGNSEAVKLGYQLVSGQKQEARVNAWASQFYMYPDSVFYCFRGGLRSQISQQWVFNATGMVIPRLEGGYKAFRNYLLSELDSVPNSTPILLGGYTGSGKTILLKELDNSIDLEGIAHHRGSSFGEYITPQPTQITFENNLAYALIQHENKAYRYVILEDEGSHIARCNIPKPIAEYFDRGDLVLIERPLEERVSITMNEYVIQSQANYLEFYGERGLLEWYNYMSASISRIKKRLGGNFKQIITSFEHAYKEQMYAGNVNLHRYWIEALLKEYYDPLYLHQIQKSTKNILFRGAAEEVLEYIRTHYGDKY
jgi:tRNA 2-selenouridine synthase